ncbi:MAG: T9SS type A sorting domain-containing protein, partial [Bacteroidales bacterium]|nr:T9SS type A sorting domain-containing protein [Bacteroidales bacterium]
NDATRLSSWLDPDGTGTPTLSTIRHPSITGSDYGCTSNTTYHLLNRPPGTTVSWTRSSNLQYVSGQGTDSYTVRAYSNNTRESGWVRASIFGSCDIPILQKNVWVGRPGLPVTTPDGVPTMEVIYGRSYLVRLFHPPGANPSTGIWSTNGSITITSGNTGSSIVFKVTGWDFGQWHVNTSNTCGTSDTYTGSVYMPMWRFNMYPNPADDYIEISAEKKEYNTKGIVSDTYEIKIFNILKSLVYVSAKTDQPLLRITTKQFINGTYFIHFTAGEQTEVKQLVVNH